MENRRPDFCPSSVYRLQMNGGFTFRDARAILLYLNELGVEAVYLSPILMAVPGSRHGYDVIDPTRLNPEIGSPADFEAFCARAKELNIGVVLDTVPNHMGIAGSHNALWMDVLENGPSSVYARFFDIDWRPVKAELKDKVLIPILGDLYGGVLERQEIQVEFDPERGQLNIRYSGSRLPLDPRTYPVLLERGIDSLSGPSDRERAEIAEYQSVITAFRRLPKRTETGPAEVRERMREKEIAKKRLADLAERSKRIREFVESRVRLFNGTRGIPASFDALDRLLDRQGYRMAFWRTAAEEINYRRFFDVNDLAAIRMEDEKVFDYCHRLLFEWIADGKIRGLRIDHPDGLYDPPVYFRRLQQRYRERLGRPPSSACLLYVAVEKILDREEPLPESWDVHGTVGYDFLNVLNGVFIDRDQGERFAQLYESFIGHAIDFDQLLYDKKKLFALVHMASEINTLGHRLDLISEKHRHYRDFTRNNLTLAIREVIACFPVYRTYISPEDEAVSEHDKRYIDIAVERAKSKTPALNPAVYDFLRDVLLSRLETEVTADERRIYRDFALRFQQITGPIMAKGLEDTSFYVHNRFISLNEVGGDPLHFGHSVEEFHRFNLAKAKRWPYGMICSSTHDTKRSEDVRARLNVLSEIPGEWESALARWAAMNEKHKTVIRGVAEPRRNAEYALYQTFLGAWPEPGGKETGDAPFRDRVWEYALKAVREAKTYTNWVNPNKEYEEAVRNFVTAVLDPETGRDFLEDLRPLREKVSAFGKLNSLSAALLKIGSPGVVDTYQGTELWNLRLVDPDNRKPVDFELRKSLFNGLHRGPSLRSADPELLTGLSSDQSGWVKLWLLAKALNFRRSRQRLFLDGDYVPLSVEGARQRNVIAFMREKGGERAVVVTGRFFTELTGEGRGAPVGEAVWEDTRVVLPGDEGAGGDLWDVLTEKSVAVRAEGPKHFVRLAEVFHSLGAAMLTNGTGDEKASHGEPD